MMPEPRATINKLTGRAMQLLSEMQFLESLTNPKTGRKRGYCFPSQSWFAKRLGVCRETANRVIANLYRLGIIDKTRRRKLNGHWQTCLYKIRAFPTWGKVRCIRLLASIGSRVTKASHIAPPPKGDSKKDFARPDPEPIKVSLRDLVSSFSDKPSPFSLKR